MRDGRGEGEGEGIRTLASAPNRSARKPASGSPRNSVMGDPPRADRSENFSPWRLTRMTTEDEATIAKGVRIMRQKERGGEEESRNRIF